MICLVVSPTKALEVFLKSLQLVKLTMALPKTKGFPTGSRNKGAAIREKKKKKRRSAHKIAVIWREYKKKSQTVSFVAKHTTFEQLKQNVLLKFTVDEICKFPSITTVINGVFEEEKTKSYDQLYNEIIYQIYLIQKDSCFDADSQEHTYENNCEMNVATLVECNKNNCHSNVCPNRYGTYQNNKMKFKVDTNEYGFGLYAQQFIKVNQHVVEYIGENIDEKEYQNRMKKLQNNNSYILRVRPGHYIDAMSQGNVARFINHSHVPNLRCKNYTNKNGYFSVHFIALRDIQIGEELTFHYGNEYSVGRFAFLCQCLKCKKAEMEM